MFGSYVFQLTVTDSSNQSSTCTVKDGAVATDDNDIVVSNNSAVDHVAGTNGAVWRESVAVVRQPSQAGGRQRELNHEHLFPRMVGYSGAGDGYGDERQHGSRRCRERVLPLRSVKVPPTLP